MFALANRRKRGEGRLGDVRLPRADALLPDSAGRAFRRWGASPLRSGCAGAQGHRLAAAHARQTREDGAVARVLRGWLGYYAVRHPAIASLPVRERRFPCGCMPPEVAARLRGRARCLARDPDRVSILHPALPRTQGRSMPSRPDCAGGQRTGIPTANGVCGRSFEHRKGQFGVADVVTSRKLVSQCTILINC